MAEKPRILTSKQQAFLGYYLNPKSETFGNARQSAVKAGFSQDYADNIMALLPDWLSESIGKLNMLQKAEKVLNKTLDYDPIDKDGKLDNQLLKTQTDVSKFVAERLGKKEWSSKQEVDVNLTSKVVRLDIE